MCSFSREKSALQGVYCLPVGRLGLEERTQRRLYSVACIIFYACEGLSPSSETLPVQATMGCLSLN